jgi:hypothetical protein
MRISSGIVALGLLAACDGAPAQPVAGDRPGPTEPLQAAPPETVAYQHVLLVGQHGDETDPADLEPLAVTAMTCGSSTFLPDHVNEPRALALGRARRDGNELTVGGRSRVDYGRVTFDGVATTHDAAFYAFGVLKRVDLDVVYINLPEDSDYELVDAGTGTSVTMNGLPIASPSGRFLVALGGDEMNFIGIEIAERGPQGLSIARKIETSTYPCGLKWLSETKASFQELKPELAAGPWNNLVPDDAQRFGASSIELVDGKWVYSPAGN